MGGEQKLGGTARKQTCACAHVWDWDSRKAAQKQNQRGGGGGGGEKEGDGLGGWSRGQRGQGTGPERGRQRLWGGIDWQKGRRARDGTGRDLHERLKLLLVLTR